MVKLTAELIEQSAQYTNPVRDRELDLRGYKIPVIENMGATLDQFDTIDLSDNDIRKFDGFPILLRLKTVLLNNNRVVRIGEDLHECLPNLESLVLSNNSMTELGDLDPLSNLKSLQHLSLLRNPVQSKKHYRLYIVHKIPQLRVLDFQRIRQKEREAAAKMFKGKKGQALASDIGKRSKTFVPGEKIPEKKTGPSKEDIELIKMAIAKAKTLNEVERLNQMLKTGVIPGKELKKLRGERVEEEEDEDMEVVNGT
ncbi:U2 small nuclear ribonucleoprotein A'-like [Crassostrea angulata]|uniref:U2A'/phosphoprotein 32 family A C-terminal domain-containing protein n=3 Tax=Magallana gigas TaxID=29159 RepID=A0A8W8JX62_MAGGI|nr:U2 small nuclear ribonucleoprotein A' [Crassostrea gigas]XP_052688787.1 U2 small nuclear ribonucleoprotein A'-like [Crassostrea angulata]|eukprot:XP_011421422.2 PREDICTED: U2 small nuclear ribonucleoprotein A' [Crassostrea gigas]